MKIRGIEVNFNFLDADDIEKFEKEAERLKQESEKRGKEKMSYPQAIREECEVINNFFDNVFGEGISLKMFNGKNNLEEHIKAFEDIVKEKLEQQRGLQNISERYQPNRAERRYSQYHNKRNR